MIYSKREAFEKPVFFKLSASNTINIRTRLLVASFTLLCENYCDEGDLKDKQLSPCGHLTVMDTSIIRTAAKSPAKINYRRLTEINSHY